jgi:hypothetical protein
MASSEPVTMLPSVAAAIKTLISGRDEFISAVAAAGASHTLQLLRLACDASTTVGIGSGATPGLSLCSGSASGEQLAAAARDTAHDLLHQGEWRAASIHVSEGERQRRATSIKRC